MGGRHSKGSSGSNGEQDNVILEHGKIIKGHSGKSAINTCALGPELLQYLASDNVLQASNLTPLGFEKCIDYPTLPEHVYYEGYFHAKRSLEGIESLNPRYGYKMTKPAAPRRLQAFIEAFRQKNQQLVTEVANLMPDGSTWKQLFSDNCCFADLAIQVHHGSEVKGMELGWHTDALNSILHMAISLHGTRQLRVKAVDEDSGKVSEYYTVQRPGSIYIASPWVFEHAPQYPACNWENRVIAVQARLLMAVGEYGALKSEVYESGKDIVADAVATALNKADLIVPTLEEVKEVERSLDDYEGKVELVNH